MLIILVYCQMSSGGKTKRPDCQSDLLPLMSLRAVVVYRFNVRYFTRCGVKSFPELLLPVKNHFSACFLSAAAKFLKFSVRSGMFFPKTGNSKPLNISSVWKVIEPSLFGVSVCVRSDLNKPIGIPPVSTILRSGSKAVTFTGNA